MIELKHKWECCGCEGCIQVCPKKCIDLISDNEGYVYPKINQSICINCHLCEKVCPYITRDSNQVKDTNKPIITLAAKNLNETIVKRSSSGGVFFELAKTVLNNGGVVFGAVFSSDYQVVHTLTDSFKGLTRMMGSKYVQSHIGNSFTEAENKLKQGKQVLFSGTPCQISALRDFLRKDYSNLITIDFVCHGVPSPGIWIKYLKEVISSHPEQFSSGIKGISFREKEGYGWSNYGFSIETGSGWKTECASINNPYMRSFITDNNLRPSCYHCVYKGKSGADITLGDFWGIDRVAPDLYDERGVSLVVINTSRGASLIPHHSFISKEVSYDDVRLYNRAIDHSSSEPITRSKFFKLATNPKITIEQAVKRVVPVESQLSLKEWLCYLPVKLRRVIYRKFKV